MLNKQGQYLQILQCIEFFKFPNQKDIQKNLL